MQGNRGILCGLFTWFHIHTGIREMLRKKILKREWRPEKEGSQVKGQKPRTTWNRRVERRACLLFGFTLEQRISVVSERAVAHLFLIYKWAEQGILIHYSILLIPKVCSLPQSFFKARADSLWTSTLEGKGPYAPTLCISLALAESDRNLSLEWWRWPCVLGWAEWWIIPGFPVWGKLRLLNFVTSATASERRRF